MILNLAANGQATLDGRGAFFYIKSATGAVQLIFERMDGKRIDYNVSERTFQIEIPGEIRRIEIIDKSGAPNTLDVQTGFGKFHTGNDGQHVILDGGTAVIEVHTAPGQPLEVKGEGAGGTLPVIGGGTSGAVPVEGVAGGVPMPVTPTTSATFTPAAQVTGTGGIGANAARRGVIIKAMKANTGQIDTGAAGFGLPLEAGDIVTIYTTAAITMTASVGTDKWGYAEF